MQAVSQEWTKNLNAVTRKQGFVIVTLTRKSGTVITIDSRAVATKILSVTHEQTYDPMGISLPTNTVSIELYNYDDAYTDLYIGDDPPQQIRVSYGYVLSSAETISGGQWVVSDMQLSDQILTISGASTLEMSSDKTIVYGDVSNLPFVMFSGDSISLGALDYNDVTEPDVIPNARDVVSKINSIVPVTGNSVLADTDVYISRSAQNSPSDVLQSIINGTLQRCTINREDKVVYSTDIPSSTQVMYINALSPYEITKAQKVSYISAQSAKLNQPGSDGFSGVTTIEQTYFTDEPSGAGISTYYYYHYFECDFYTYALYKVTFSRGASAYEVSCGYFQVRTGRVIQGYRVKYYDRSAVVVTFSVYPRAASTQITSDTYNADGQVCDLTNEYCEFKDPDKLADYFGNTILRDIEIRGYPEIDAGDYIELQQKDGSYDVCLVLSHELEFDGRFVSNIRCRAINKVFEDVPSGSHLHLSQYTHQQLSEYTHQQLSEGAI